MNRREVLQRTALTMGYALSAPVVAAVLNGCKAKPTLTFKPVFFNEDEAALVAEIAETILPKTTTPGAKDSGVPAFIDDMLATVYTAEQQKSFRDGLATFSSEASKELGNDFIDCTPQQKLEFVTKKNDEAVESLSGAGSEGWWRAGGGSNKPFFLDIKELTILGFFSSKEGATEVLQYNQSPGPYRGCVPLAEIGKAWAT